MGYDANIILKLVERIYDAALDPEQWPSTIEAIIKAVGGDIGILFHRDSLQGSGVAGKSYEQLANYGYDMSALTAYQQYYGGIDIREPFAASLQPGDVYVDNYSLPFATVERSEIFNDFWRPLSAGHGMAMRPYSDSSRITFLSVHRELSLGEFGANEIDLFKHLAPHMTRALQLYRQCTELIIGRESASQALDGLSAGFVLVDRSARILWANATAERLFREADALMTIKGQIAARNGNTAKTLRKLIGRAVDTASSNAAVVGDVLRIERNCGGAPLAALVCPVRPTSTHIMANIPCAMVIIKDTDVKLKLLPNTLAKLYGLTPAESRVVEELASGKTIDQISRDFGCRISTARTHLKNSFDKTDTARQCDLIRLINSLPTAYL